MKSLRFQLSTVFVLCLLLLGVVGIFSMATLNDVNKESESIRDHWLQSTRIIGDLNNFTSDYRAAEASHLLATNAAFRQQAESELAALSKTVAEAMNNYEKLPHAEFETVMYRRFKRQWNDYIGVEQQVVALKQSNQIDAAQNLFLKNSRTAYTAASDTLGELTSLTVSAASDASAHATGTYLKAKQLMLGAIVIAVLGVIAVVLYINRFVTLPLSALAQSMRALAANDTDLRLQGQTRKDEIGEMARAVAVFRNNAIELAQSQLGLMQQATMLEEKLEQEQRLSTLQRNFVSMVSHEFRTPLTIIDGHAQRLIKLKSSLTPDSLDERAHKIRGAVLRMTRVMESLLISSRLFEGEPSLHYHPASLNPAKLLHDICNLHREITPGAHILEDFHQLPTQTRGDVHLLYQAISNLLSNALKYSAQGREVWVRAKIQNAHLHISVTDSGIGVPPQDLPALFERYHRGGNVSGITGTGIGLYLVKMVVQLHGGQVSVQSELGHGSEFKIVLPA